MQLLSHRSRTAGALGVFVSALLLGPLSAASVAQGQAVEPREAPAEPAEPAAEPAPEPEPGPQIHAGFGEGFSIESGDGQQSLRIAGLLSARGSVINDDGAPVDFDARVRLARIALQGELFGSKLTYFFNTEFVGTPRVLDAELTYSPIEQLRLRFGRMRTPAGRQWIVALGQLGLPDRSVSSDYFRSGWDTGMAIESYLADKKLELRAGIYAEGADRWPLGVARVAYSPLGPLPLTEHLARDPGPTLFQVGLSATIDKRVPTTTRADLVTGEIVTVDLPPLQRAVGMFDFALRAGPVAVFAEAYLDRRQSQGARGQMGAGAFGQAGVFVVPHYLELLGRFNFIAPDLRASGADGLYRYELGLSYHLLNSALKVQLRYAYDMLRGAPVGMPFPQGHIADAQFVLAL